MTTTHFTAPPSTQRAGNRLSQAAGELGASKILRIAGEIRALVAAGQPIFNLTVGDFSPAGVSHPEPARRRHCRRASGGESNYPPPNGHREFAGAPFSGLPSVHLACSIRSTRMLVTSGARPAIYSPVSHARGPQGSGRVRHSIVVQQLLLRDRGRHAGARRVRRLHQFSAYGGEAREGDPRSSSVGPQLAAQSNRNRVPSADTGGDLRSGARGKCAAGADRRPLYRLLRRYVYWMLMVGDTAHADPVALRPEMAPYTVTVDAISKSFAATGLRVGWALGPSDVIASMGDLVGLVGAWAPRAEQVATARFLSNEPALHAYAEAMRREVGSRVGTLASGLLAMRAEGLPVDCVKPEGAIYVSARFNLSGMRTSDGTRLGSDEQVRQYLLRAAGLAAVPFDAFDLDADSGWFRLSVGVVSVKQIEQLLPRIRRAVLDCQA